MLASELHGDLRCLGCKYSLKGLSIRSACPECGLAVRATLLALVDPKAPLLQKVRFPRLTAYGLIAWALGACVAALGVWSLRIEEMLGSMFGINATVPFAAAVGVAGVVISGLGAAVSLIKPYETTVSKDKLAALGAVLAYGPLVLIFWQIHTQVDGVSGPPYFGIGDVNPTRIALRLAMAVLMAVIIVGLRPNAKTLAERSMVLRTGRVDRQSMLALLAALGVAALGDLIRVITRDSAAPVSDIIRIGDTALVGVGSLLFTVGLVGILLDTLRLRGVIERKVIGLADVLGPETPASERTAKSESAAAAERGPEPSAEKPV